MVIRIRNLGFSYPGKPVLNGINLDAGRGEIIGIVGGTGSGKTTFSLCLNGIIPNMIKGDFSGSVEISGKNTKSSEVFDMAKTVGMIFQDPDSQIFSVGVRDEISFGLENMGLPKKEINKRVDGVLDALGIRELENSETFKLSQGQKQKVCMASVLAMDPEVLVLDEPTSQLDYRGTKDIYEIILSLRKRGKTVIIIEHKVDWILENADRVLVLDGGKFVLDGKPFDVFRKTIIGKIGIEVPRVIRLERMLRKRGMKIDAVNMCGV